MTIQLESTHKEDIMSRRTSLTLLRSVFPGVEVFYTREGHTQPQDKCIKANPDAKLFMAYQNSQKDRMYMAFSQIEDFIVPYMQKMAFKPEARFFEIITSGCNMFFDMDLENPEITEKEAISKALDLFARMSLEQLNKELDSSKFRITTATKEGKISVHFNYCDEMGFESSTHQGLFIKDYKEELKALGIDLGVYTSNRCMRILGSTKYGEERYLYPKDNNGVKLNRKKINPADYIISNTSGNISIKSPLLEKIDTKCDCDGKCEFCINDDESDWAHLDNIWGNEEQNEILDSVHANCMRQIKFDVKSGKRKAKTDLISDEITKLPKEIKFALDLFKEDKDSESQDLDRLKSYEKNDDGSYFVNFYRKSPGHCSICNRTHDNDNCVGLLVDIPNNKIFHRCNRSKDYVKSAEVQVRYLGKLNNIEPKENISVITKTLERVLAMDVKKIEAKITTDFEKIATVHKYDAKYCGDNMTQFLASKATIMAHKADMGLGKTVAVAQILAHEASLNPKSRGISITNRQSLSKQMNRTLSDGGVLGAVCYLDFKKESEPWKLDSPEYRYMGISPESLYKMNLAKNKREYLLDTLLIDEIDSAMQQFTGDTFRNRPSSGLSWRKFESYVRETKRIIIMDANLTAEHVKWIQKIRSKDEETVDVFWNQRQNLKGRKLEITGSQLDIMVCAGKDLEAGRKIMIASNIGTDNLKAIKDTLQKKTTGTILLICRDTLHEEAVKSALANPVDTWHNYAGIIYSPSMESGVSYDVPNVIHRVYAIFSNFTSIANSAAQMVNRCRAPIDKTLMCSIAQTNNNIGPTTEEEIFKHLHANQEHLESVGKEVKSLTENTGVDYDINEQNIKVLKKNSYMKLYLRNEALRNKSLSNFLLQFLLIHHTAGYEITKYIPIESEEQLTGEYKTLISEAKKINTKTEAETVSKAVDIDADQTKNIAKKIENHEATQDEIHQIKKRNLIGLYDIKPASLPIEDDKNTDWFEKFGQRKVKSHYRAHKRIYGKQNFGEALTSLKLREQEIEKNRIINLVSREDTDSKDRIIYNTMTQTNRRLKYKPYEVLLGWLAKFGIQSLDSKIELTSDEILKTVIIVHKDIIKKQKNIKAVLNKTKSKMSQIIDLDPDDDKFKKRMLEFINGAISSEFGITIKKKSKHEEIYYLHNKYHTSSEIIPRFAFAGVLDKEYIPKLSIDAEINYDDDTSEGEDL